MIIKQYDVSFQRLRHEQIEEVRNWRNSEKIKARMEYRDFITQEMQEKWFKQVSDIERFIYFVIIVSGKSIGIIHAKDLSVNNTEAGMFIWDDSYLNSHIPVVASICLTDWTFYFLQNTHVYCRMLPSNIQALNYNKSLGFKICEGQENMPNQLYYLSKADYEAKALPLRALLQNTYKGIDNTISISLEKEDDNWGVAAFIKRYYSKYENSKSPVPFQLLYL